MNQELFREELRDLQTWLRKVRRFGRVADFMSPEEVVARAMVLASSGGVEQHYAQLRAEGRRNTHPGFLTVASTQSDDRERPQRLEKLFRRL